MPVDASGKVSACNAGEDGHFLCPLQYREVRRAIILGCRTYSPMGPADGNSGIKLPC